MNHPLADEICPCCDLPLGEGAADSHSIGEFTIEVSNDIVPESWVGNYHEDCCPTCNMSILRSRGYFSDHPDKAG
jgi:hypothetical protein